MSPFTALFPTLACRKDFNKGLDTPMSDAGKIGAIDAVVNIWTEEALSHRPDWGDEFFTGKMKAKNSLMAGLTLDEMIEKRRWILEDGGYHLDTTHLSSTVRIASVLDEPQMLKKAWELTQYGRRLPCLRPRVITER